MRNRVSRPQAALSRPQPVVDRVSRPQVVRSLPQPVVYRVNHLLLALPHPPQEALRPLQTLSSLRRWQGFCSLLLVGRAPS